MSFDLVKLDQARQLLAECKSAQEAKGFVDIAEAARHYAKVKGLGIEAANYATEIKLRAIRRLGEILRETPLQKGRPEKNGHGGSTVFLSDIDITKNQSSQAQSIASIPEEIFEQHITETKAKEEELTSAACLRLAKGYQRESHREQVRENSKPEKNVSFVDNCHIVVGDACNMDLSQFPNKYGVIIADPPWPYRVAKGQGVAEDEYSVMTDEDLQAMPVSKLAADDCALFLWGTWPKLPEALALMRSWGFEYVTGLPWVKTSSNSLNGKRASDITLSYGVGYWVRGTSEYILIGRRGKVSAPRMEGFMGLLSPNLQHSRKPDSVHDIAEALPGPYLELFARRGRPGWTVFGNEIQGSF